MNKPKKDGIMPEDNLTDAANKETTTMNQRNTKFCSNCGAQIDEKAIICPKCGVQVAPVGGYREPKSRTTAIILALFLGGHRDT